MPEEISIAALMERVSAISTQMDKIQANQTQYIAAAKKSEDMEDEKKEASRKAEDEKKEQMAKTAEVFSAVRRLIRKGESEEDDPEKKAAWHKAGKALGMDDDSKEEKTASVIRSDPRIDAMENKLKVPLVAEITSYAAQADPNYDAVAATNEYSKMSLAELETLHRRMSPFIAGIKTNAMVTNHPQPQPAPQQSPYESEPLIPFGGSFVPLSPPVSSGIEKFTAEYEGVSDNDLLVKAGKI